MKYIKRFLNIISIIIVLFIGYVGYLMITGKDTSIVDKVAEVATSKMASEVLEQVFPDIPENDLEIAISGVTIKNDASTSSLSYDVPATCPESFDIEELSKFNIDVDVNYKQNGDLCTMQIIYNK